ncbi:MAG TPA: hypothetical protein V6C85_01340 [Allocoleopsis sp.]
MLKAPALRENGQLGRRRYERVEIRSLTHFPSWQSEKEKIQGTIAFSLRCKRSEAPTTAGQQYCPRLALMKSRSRLGYRLP